MQQFLLIYFTIFVVVVNAQKMTSSVVVVSFQPTTATLINATTAVDKNATTSKSIMSELVDKLFATTPRAAASSSRVAEAKIVTTAPPSKYDSGTKVVVANTTLKALSATDGVATFSKMNATAVTYDCRRYQHDCDFDGGLCDMDTGKCACSPGFTGFDCSARLSLLAAHESDCNGGKGCGETGHCLKGVKSASCKCAYGLTGDLCEKPSIQLKCNEASMVLEILPYPTFADFEGLLYLVNMSVDTMVEAESCRFQQDAGVYRFESSYDDIINKCGGKKTDENTFATKFIIQSDPHWLTPFDQVFNVKCVATLEQSYERAVIVSVSGSANARGLSGQIPVGVSNSLTNLPLNSIVAEHRRVQPFEMPKLSLSVGRIKVDPQSGNYSISPLSEALRIGDPVMITVTNVNSTFYTSLRPEDCLMKMDNSIEMKLIAKSCPASKFAWSLLRWDRTIVTNSSVSLWLLLPANALAGQSRFVDIYCRVKVCTQEASSDCEFRKNSCNQTTVVSGRRRREVATDDLFSSYPFVYTTVHSRFRLADDVEEADERKMISDRLSGHLPRSSAVVNLHHYGTGIVTLICAIITTLF